MQAFLIGAGGGGVGLALLALLGTRRLGLKAGGVGPVIGATLGAARLPPFRLTLAPAAAPAWADAADVQRALQGFTAAGYIHCGDFVIPELEGLCLRSFFHRGLGSLVSSATTPRRGSSSTWCGSTRTAPGSR